MGRRTASVVSRVFPSTPTDVARLNFRVRNGYGCFPGTLAVQPAKTIMLFKTYKFSQISWVVSKGGNLVNKNFFRNILKVENPKQQHNTMYKVNN